jgi:hypothetical protein
MNQSSTSRILAAASAFALVIFLLAIAPLNSQTDKQDDAKETAILIKLKSNRENELKMFSFLSAEFAQFDARIKYRFDKPKIEEDRLIALGYYQFLILTTSQSESIPLILDKLRNTPEIETVEVEPHAQVQGDIIGRSLPGYVLGKLRIKFKENTKIAIHGNKTDSDSLNLLLNRFWVQSITSAYRPLPITSTITKQQISHREKINRINKELGRDRDYLLEFPIVINAERLANELLKHPAIENAEIISIGYRQ